MATTLIGFGHRSRVGKDTATRFLIQHLRVNGYKGSIERGSLAFEAKLQCHKLFKWGGLNHPDYYEQHQAEKEVVLSKIGKSPRQIWIEYCIGLQSIVETSLIDYLIYQTQDVDIVVISDLRRVAEADRIHRMGGYVIKIDNPRIVASSDPVDSALAEYCEWDHIIDNSKDLNHFHAQVIDLIPRFGIK